MTTYADDVRPALVPLLALQEQFQEDLSVEDGGFFWWHGFDLPPSGMILISDYLMSLPHSIEMNLVEAAMHAKQIKELWYAEGMSWRKRLRQREDTDRWLDLNDRDKNRVTEASAHLAGFFRSVGSVIDNLAALVIGVGGLRLDIAKADVSGLRLNKETPRGLALDEQGRQLQLALVFAMKEAMLAGPQCWWEWSDDLRNTLVHRARRVELVMFDRGKDNLFVRPLPRHPKQTDAEARARSGRQLGEFLDEDAEVTIAGILRDTTEVTRATASKAVATWQLRRIDPALLPQPLDQWPTTKQGREVPFDGYAPTGLPKQSAGSSLYMNPNRSRRLAAGKLTDSTLHVWREWLAE